MDSASFCKAFIPAQAALPAQPVRRKMQNWKRWVEFQGVA
jgi:hypothetical protein